MPKKKKKRGGGGTGPTSRNSVHAVFMDVSSLHISNGPQDYMPISSCKSFQIPQKRLNKKEKCISVTFCLVPIVTVSAGRATH